jgi:hypothetical protein
LGSGQKCKILSEKITKNKRAGAVAQVLESLPSKPEALNSMEVDGWCYVMTFGS